MPNALKRSGAKAINSFSRLFESAHLRLTAIYVIILAFILFISSSITYSAFSNRLEHRFQGLPPRSIIVLSDDFRSPTPEQVREDLIDALLFVNGLLLLAAGILSYWLAKLTLEPIQLAYERQRRFLSDASHELRTPLAILQLELENEKTSSSLASVQMERVNSHLEEVHRMSHLVQDLLALSRFDEQVHAPELQTTNLTNVLESVVTRLTPIADQAHVHLEVNLSGPALLIHSNAELLLQALSNLVKNGIHYNKVGGTVTLTATKDESEALVTIQDSGVGIAETDVDKIFERFYRVDQSRSRQTGGSGLGLAIVRSIIEQLQGTIHLESTLGVGTTVRLRFPLAEASSFLHETSGTVEK